jgi:hypothetical protein
MAYGFATHGTWCNTHTYRTRCRYCGEEVFYFSCDCGCKVFFDSLGSPWPEHNCMERWIAELGPQTFGQFMAWRMMQPGVSIGRTIANDHADRLRAQAEQRAKLEPIPCEPRPGDVTEEVGPIFEVCQQINLAKQLRVPPDSPLGAALLAALGRGPVWRMAIHTGSLEEDDFWRFTFFVSQDLMAKRSIVMGDLVRCRLRGIATPTGAVWLCEAIWGGW